MAHTVKVVILYKVMEDREKGERGGRAEGEREREKEREEGRRGERNRVREGVEERERERGERGEGESERINKLTFTSFSVIFSAMTCSTPVRAKTSARWPQLA